MSCGNKVVARQHAAVVPGGCNLNRAIPELIEHAGFGIQRMETGFLPKVPRFAGFNFWGAVAPR
ncbi:hypothetical protein GCM10007160_12110 [Litchfieldella qijiaojingensis]|uniref:Uncharacterized protein n=1 Tax=Litchfieldella qijiaojingensis TaxID=980347 RepID=A0ABQ2YK54_9GAMM|nr:hypothetical protein GCM10007160_12110 [Halomonas qijiaojingensis]